MALKPNLTMPWMYNQGINISNWTPDTLGDVIDVYVNSSTGADTNPGTTAALPFLSIMRALEASFFSLSDGLTVRINLAGAADHSMSAGYTFPMLFSSDAVGSIAFDATTSPYGFTKRSALIIQATPTLSATVTIVSQADNANSGQKEITAAGLTLNALNGKFGVDAAGVLFRVRSNTTTVMKLNYAGADLTSPLKIYTEGATIVAADTASAIATLTVLGGSAPLVLNGVIVESSTGGSLQLGPGQTAVAMASTLDDLSLGQEPNTNVQGFASFSAVGCQLKNFNAPVGNINLSNCNISAGTITNVTSELSVTVAASSFNSMVSALFGSASSHGATAGLVTGTNLFVSGAGALNVHQNGGRMTLTTCDIAAATQIGVRVEDYAFVKLLDCTSSTINGTNGVSVQTGASVQVDNDTTITGTTADIAVQGLTAISFTTFRLGTGSFKVASAATGAQIYQATTGATALPQTSTATTAVDLQLTNDNEFVTVDTTGGSRTVTLPLASVMVGRKITVLKLVAGNSMIVEGSGAETINGAANKTTATQFGTITVISDGTTWWIVSTFGTIT